MRKVLNLATDEEVTFSDEVTPEYAVAFCYYREKDMISWFLAVDRAYRSAVKKYKFIIPAWSSESDFIYGNHSVALGDWACRLVKLADLQIKSTGRL